MHTPLLHMFRINQAYAHRLVDDVGEDRMCLQPAAKMNHPAWVLGHLAVVGDRMRSFLGHEAALPESWHPLFGGGSTPSPDASAYPDKAALIEAYDAVHDRLAQAYQRADDDALAAPNTHVRPHQMPTLHDLVTYGMSSHEATHLGQLSAWRRAAAMPAV